MKLEDYRKLIQPKKRKYNNKPTYFRGIKCDSIKEAKFFAEIYLLWRSGDIKFFILHPKFLLPGDITYTADILYQTKDNKIHVCDCKGSNTIITQVFRIKQKLMKEVYNIDVEIK